jgi:hypothetical protein
MFITLSLRNKPMKNYHAERLWKIQKGLITEKQMTEQERGESIMSLDIVKMVNRMCEEDGKELYWRGTHLEERVMGADYS